MNSVSRLATIVLACLQYMKNMKDNEIVDHFHPTKYSTTAAGSFRTHPQLCCVVDFSKKIAEFGWKLHRSVR